MKSKEEIIKSGLLEQYVLGLASEQEKLDIAKYFSKYPELKQYCSEIEGTMEKIAFQNSIDPPPHIKGEMLEQINRLKDKNKLSSPNKKSISKSIFYLLIASFLLMLAGLLFSIYNTSILKKENKRLDDKYAQLEVNCIRNISDLERKSNLLAFFQSNNTRSLTLLGTSISPESQVIVQWSDKEKKVMISDINLPPAPTGKTYQIWADIEGEMVDMGVIDIKNKFIELPYMSSAASLNITLEKLGGSDHPNVAQLYVNGKVV